MNAVVTGASNGIGYGTALRLARGEGSCVVAVSRDAGRLSGLAAEAARTGKGKIVTAAIDLLTLGDAGLSDILDRHGIDRVDALINNAGRLVNKPFDKLARGDWQAVYATNVFAPVAVIRQVLSRMGGERPSHIVNIGSYGGFQGSAKFPGLSAYSSSKAALANLSECLAEEFRDRNIRVNCLALGAVQTEMLQQAFPGLKAPLTPEKMSEFIAWFALEGGAYFNGKVLPVALAGV